MKTIYTYYSKYKYIPLKISTRKVTNNWKVSIIEEKLPSQQIYSNCSSINTRKNVFFITDILSKTGVFDGANEKSDYCSK